MHDACHKNGLGIMAEIQRNLDGDFSAFRYMHYITVVGRVNNGTGDPTSRMHLKCFPGCKRRGIITYALRICSMA